MHRLVPESDWFESTGRLIYDPVRPGLKSKTDWWCVLNVDSDIARYYRWWVDKEVLNPLGFDKGGLCLPSHGAHISVIRGEKPYSDKMHLWKKYDRQIIPFRYRPYVRQSGDTTGGDRPSHYWFVDIQSDQLDDIRREFGFKVSEGFMHLTIGRTYD